MRTNADRNWDMLERTLAAESSGKSPRLFSSRRTLFGIPSALDQELASLEEAPLKPEGAAVGLPQKSDSRKPTHVRHTISPVFDERSRVLVLGTMPSPKSRETGFYYGHPQNRFWPLMARLLGAPVPQTIPEKKALLLVAGGTSYADAASICGCRVGTIKSRVNRARESLRRTLA